jgi:zinc transport system substrate-binding protein
MKKLLFTLLFAVIIGFGIFLVSNSPKKAKTDSQKITVVTTLFPLYDFAKNIGQDKVDVSLLLPPGVETHSYEPKPSDIVKINKSDLFVYTGKFMEPWAEDIIKGVTNKEVKFVNTSVGIDLIKLTEGMPDEAHGFDPHIWLDFDNNKIMVDSLAKALIEKDPANADFYQRNAIDYKNKLAQLDSQYKSVLNKCENSTIVYGGHYAFGYLTKRYNLKYLAAQGLSPDAEPTANDLVKLVEQVKKNNIRYVFYEEMTSSKIAETIANETKAKMLLLNAAHNLTKDDFERNVSFLSIMETNLTNLKIGLGCSK